VTRRASERARRKESENRQIEREREPPWCAGEPCFEEDRERTTERGRARELEIKRSETHDARKRKRQRVQCDTCTHKCSVASGYCTPLITRPDSTPSHVFICQKTEYFSSRRQLQGKIVSGVSPVVELRQAHHSTACLSLSKALAHDSAATHLKMFQWIDTECRKPQMGEQCQQTNNV